MPFAMPAVFALLAAGLVAYTLFDSHTRFSMIV